MNYENAVRNIRTELKTYIEKNNLKSLVIGVSGGIDSALCVLLAKPVCKELNIPLIGRSLPSKSNSLGENMRAKEIGELFCTDFLEKDISVWMDVAIDANESENRVTEEERAIQDGNIKARVRMIMLYDLASTHKGMVLSTDNYTELLLGFWTLHGDVGDYGMIQNLWKTEVYEMTEWLQTHEFYHIDEQVAIRKVLSADATDGLGISKTDLDQIMPGWSGSSRDGYKEVDHILQNYILPLGPKYSDEENPVIKRHLNTRFKRNNPYNINRKNIVK